MKSKRTGGALSALLAFAFLLVGVVVPAGTAIAVDSLQFSMSASSVRAGQAVVVTEVDPCPAPDPSSTWQSLSVSFTDASGGTSWYGKEVDAQGHWGSITVIPPSRRVLSLNPVEHSSEAAMGQGTISVRCVEENVVSFYESQLLAINAASAEYAISIPPSKPGFARLQSSNPCPVQSSSVHVIMDDMDTNTVEYDTSVGLNGHWQADVPVPSWYPVRPVYFRVWCYSDPNGGGTRLQMYGEKASAINLNERYYVAMGDSYSSGVGTFNYDVSSGSCRRSSESYVSYVANQRNLGTSFFVACGGAQTADFYGQNPSTGETRQLNAPTNATGYVTLTIGGNDVGFGEVMGACAHYPGHNGWECADNASVVSALSNRIDTLAGTANVSAPDGRQITPLAEVLDDIATKAPGARIYVGGYPRLFGSDQGNYTINGNAPGGAQCAMSPGATVSFSDAQWLNQVANDLNDVIEDAVGTAQASGVDVTFVPAALFSTHGLCDSNDPWLNGVVLDDPPNPSYKPESLHPTAEGYENGYGVAFSTIIG